MITFASLIRKSKTFRDAERAAKANAEALSWKLAGVENLNSVLKRENARLRTELGLLTPVVERIAKKLLVSAHVDMTQPQVVYTLVLGSETARAILAEGDMSRVVLQSIGNHFAADIMLRHLKGDLK